MIYNDQEIRNNAPGELARTIGKQFILLALSMDNDRLAESEESFDEEHKSVFINLIELRMQTLPNDQEKKLIRDENNKTVGVLGLCISILKVEGDLHLNDYEAIKQIITIMAEELKSAGVGQKSIFGAVNSHNNLDEKINTFSIFAEKIPKITQ
tara:strand:+ start:596 stop:1057 length:462 start_codon:yes stop_codon:yes gene_type:complete